MKEIPLRNQRHEILGYALVDDDDYESVVAAGPWHRHGKDRDTFWARHTGLREDGTRYRLLLHHFLMGECPEGHVIDHRDGDGLNNQRSNLRFATHSENSQNRKHQTNNTSGYRGVAWHKRLQKWQVRCATNGTRLHLGYYDDLEVAAAVARTWREENMTFLEREEAHE